MTNKPLTPEELKLEDCICPECSQDYNGLRIESSCTLGISKISCSECGFSVEDSVCEEDLTEQFLQVYKDSLNF